MAMDVLRIKVAEASGWRIFDEQGNPIAYPFNEVDLSGIPPGGAMDEPVPSYTTSMDACMELLEETRWYKDSLGNWYETQVDIELEAGIWRVFIYTKEDLITAWNGCGETLPEAICKAYLAWKGDSQ